MNSGVVAEILNVGGPEMMLIIFIALLLFGGKKLPELARGLGKGIREFKDASEGVKREIQKNIEAVQNDVDVSKSIDLNKKPAEIQESVTGEKTHLN